MGRSRTDPCPLGRRYRQRHVRELSPPHQATIWKHNVGLPVLAIGPQATCRDLARINQYVSITLFHQKQRDQIGGMPLRYAVERQLHARFKGDLVLRDANTVPADELLRVLDITGFCYREP